MPRLGRRRATRRASRGVHREGGGTGGSSRSAAWEDSCGHPTGTAGRGKRRGSKSSRWEPTNSTATICHPPPIVARRGERRRGRRRKIVGHRRGGARAGARKGDGGGDGGKGGGRRARRGRGGAPSQQGHGRRVISGHHRARRNAFGQRTVILRPTRGRRADRRRRNRRSRPQKVQNKSNQVHSIGRGRAAGDGDDDGVDRRRCPRNNGRRERPPPASAHPPRRGEGDSPDKRGRRKRCRPRRTGAGTDRDGASVWLQSALRLGAAGAAGEMISGGIRILADFPRSGMETGPFTENAESGFAPTPLNRRPRYNNRRPRYTEGFLYKKSLCQELVQTIFLRAWKTGASQRKRTRPRRRETLLRRVVFFFSGGDENKPSSEASF